MRGAGLGAMYLDLVLLRFRAGVAKLPRYEAPQWAILANSVRELEEAGVRLVNIGGLKNGYGNIHFEGYSNGGSASNRDVYERLQPERLQDLA